MPYGIATHDRARWREVRRCGELLALASLALTSACAGDSPTLDPHRIERLALASADGQTGRAIELASFGGDIVADGTRPAHLKLEGRRRKQLRIPGPVDLRPFERVEVELLGASTADLELRLAVPLDPTRKTSLDVDRGFERSDPVPCRIDQGATTRVALEVPKEMRTGLDDLRVQIEGRPPDGFGLVGVRLAESEEGTWIEVDEDRRLGRWLVPGRELVGRARAAERLAFDVHRPGEGDDDGASTARLSVTIAGVTEERELRGATWTHVELPLPGTIANGDEVEVRFALQAADAEAAAIAGAHFHTPRVTAPTVLLVTSDTHRADHLGVTDPDGAVRTPVLDRLAARGVVFVDAFASSNVTVPSHAALLTGVHPRDSNAADNRSVLADSAHTLAESFRAAGWLTYASVSAGFLGAVNLHQGFDRLSAPPADARPANRTIGPLERWLPDAEGQPLFVWLHLFDAHSPYEPPQEFIDQHWSSARDPRDPTLASPILDGLELPPGALGVRDLDYVDACYRAEVGYLDAELDRILARERFQRGIVAVTSDHGECLGTHGGWHHRETLPHTLHVPLILAWPDAPAGTFVDDPVRQIDVGRTLLDLAGIVDAAFPGRDLLQAAERASTVRFALAGERRVATVVTDESVLVLYLTEHEGQERHTVQLFDRTADPDCLEDLAASAPERAAELRSALIDWLSARRRIEGGETAAIPLAELKALGYAYGETPALGSDWFDPDCDCARCARFR